MAKDEPVNIDPPVVAYPTEQPIEPPKALSKFAQLAAALAEAGEDEEANQATIDQILRLIADLPREDAKRLMSNPDVAELIQEAADRQAPPAGRQPGDIIYQTIGGQKTSFGKVPWTMAALRARFPERTFTPNRRQIVTWGGVSVGLEADQEVSLPDVFYNEWLRSNQDTRRGEQWARWFFNQDVPHPDPSSMTPQEVIARARMDKGNYLPGAGVTSDMLEHARQTRAAPEPAGAAPDA